MGSFGRSNLSEVATGRKTLSVLWREMTSFRGASRFLVRLIVSTVAVSAIFVVTQPIQVFPGIVDGWLGNVSELVPEGVESILLETTDGVYLELWRLAPAAASAVASGAKSPVVLIFHGNAGDVRNFFVYQRYFESLGFTSYGFDYRGFGNSTGFPTERGIYEDTRHIFRHIAATERISTTDIVPVGVSIGSGPAARAAREFDSRSLVLFTPYISLRTLVEELPLFGYLAKFGFLWYEFPTLKDAQASKARCIILAHGHQDQVIPFHHATTIVDALKMDRARTVLLVEPNQASHNDILSHSGDELAPILRSCL